LVNELTDKDPNQLGKTIIIVSGIPRSGTSMAMQILEAGGVPIFTDKKRKPDENNPKGYYEVEAVKRLDKDNSIIKKTKGKAVKVISHLLPYLPEKFEYKLIFMKRNIDEVIRSQQKMLGKDPNDYPQELKDIFLNFKGYDFLHIGRSKRAFATHPLTQQKTEYITNKIGSKTIGFSEIRDIISVCFIINKRLAEKVIKMDHITTTGFYGTWPLVFWRWAETKEYIEVGGLEWETPDKYETEINDIGYDKWLSQFQSQEEWIKRAEMLEDCLSELLNLTDIEFLPEI